MTEAQTRRLDLRFRLATHDDVRAIVALVERTYRGDASRAGWTTEADLLEGQRIDPQGVMESIEGDHSRVVLAHSGTDLVACAHIQRRSAIGYFGMFSVDTGHQGSGLGGTVLAECERQLRDDLDCNVVQIIVLKQRVELIGWYQRRDYRLTGERRPFPYGDERFGLPRVADLEFVVLHKSLSADRAPA